MLHYLLLLSLGAVCSCSSGRVPEQLEPGRLLRPQLRSNSPPDPCCSPCYRHWPRRESVQFRINNFRRKCFLGCRGSRCCGARAKFRSHSGRGGKAQRVCGSCAHNASPFFILASHSFWSMTPEQAPPIPKHLKGFLGVHMCKRTSLSGQKMCKLPWTLKCVAPLIRFSDSICGILSKMITPFFSVLPIVLLLPALCLRRVRFDVCLALHMR